MEGIEFAIYQDGSRGILRNGRWIKYWPKTKKVDWKKYGLIAALWVAGTLVAHLALISNGF